MYTCVLLYWWIFFASFNWEGVSKIWYTSSRIVYFFSAINWYYKVEQNYHPVEKSRYTAYFTLVLSMLLHWVPAAFISPFLHDVLVSGISKAWKVHFAKQCRQWESLITIFFIKIILCMLNKSSFKLVINIRFSLTPL